MCGPHYFAFAAKEDSSFIEPSTKEEEPSTVQKRGRVRR
jgi:hypothetical protein